MFKGEIYLDLDGVLVDFLKGFQNISNLKNPNDVFKLLNTDEFEWYKMTNEDFWSNLEWEYKGKDLWNIMKHFNPYILSAYPYSKGAVAQHKHDAIIGKLNWVKREIGEFQLKRTIICNRNEKVLYAKNNLLIDDYEKNINEWKRAGGFGILYKGYDETIDEILDIIEGANNYAICN